jgi:glycosyltransferase involved in cell wall biosynthesis
VLNVERNIASRWRPLPFLAVIAAERDSTRTDGAELDLVLDFPLPNALPVGQATALFCAGTCFHRHRAVEELVITVDGMPHRATAHGMPRFDRFRSLHPTVSVDRAASLARDPESSRDPELHSYRSGFWATVPIQAQASPRELELGVEARLAGGAAARASLGTIAVVQRAEAPSYEGLPAIGRPLIAICMATFNPEPGLFQTQVESIREQSDRDWICLISDDGSRADRFEAIRETIGGDPRFVISRSDQRLGFYRNFERALRMVPPEVEFVALSDHDDRWYPDKLAVLRNAIGDAELVYSDQRLVDAEGRVRRETLWRGRRNNYTNLASLLVSNTIAGAASLFRRRVIDYAVPFPGGPGWKFHDHWLALVAMTLGEVVYVDRPLYDYVQHPGAVLGRAASDPEPPRPRPRASLDRWRGFTDRWRAAYFHAYLDREVQAQVLLARCGTAVTQRKRRALRLLINADRSPLAFAWLASRPARALLGRNETLRFEDVLVRGILWRYLVALRAGRGERPTRSMLDASPPPFHPDSVGSKRLRRWLAHA